ncbi:MAG TPA: hypothetical protein VGU66_07105 [Candidatus Elarobacter sp.]|nr:hypothetical protein [Candidatus Elarobacter sp.]
MLSILTLAALLLLGGSVTPVLKGAPHDGLPGGPSVKAYDGLPGGPSVVAHELPGDPSIVTDDGLTGGPSH